MGRAGRAGGAARVGGGAGVVTVHRSDTSLAEECGGVAARLRDSTRGGLHAGDALGTVLHASGVLRDAMLAGQRAGGVREVMAAKVRRCMSTQ